MMVSYFVHIYGSLRAASALLAAVEPTLKAMPAAVMHVPIALPGADPLPVDADERLLLCQLSDRALVSEVDRVARSVEGVHELTGC